MVVQNVKMKKAKFASSVKGGRKLGKIGKQKLSIYSICKPKTK